VEKARKTVEVGKIKERLAVMEARDDVAMVAQINSEVAAFQLRLHQAAGIETNVPPPKLVPDSLPLHLLSSGVAGSGGSAAGYSAFPSNDVALSSNNGGMAVDPAISNMDDGGVAVRSDPAADDFVRTEGPDEISDTFLQDLQLMAPEPDGGSLWEGWN